MGSGNTVKMAIKSMGIDDSTPTENGENKNPIQQMQIQTYDAVKQCGKLGHYGFYGNAPRGSLVIAIQANGQEECLYGAEDDVNNRPRGLKEGEVMMYNTITKSYIYLDAEGNCKVYSKKDMQMQVEGTVNITVTGNANVTCPNTTVKGNLTVDGDLTVTGTASAGVVSAGNGATGSGDVVTFENGIVTG